VFHHTSPGHQPIPPPKPSIFFFFLRKIGFCFRSPQCCCFFALVSIYSTYSLMSNFYASTRRRHEQIIYCVLDTFLIKFWGRDLHQDVSDDTHRKFGFFTLATKLLATVLELGHYAARAGIGSLEGNSLGEK